jgi:hypothetical protein
VAIETRTRILDDLDGTELPDGTEPTRFSLAGTDYELDLGEENREKLRAALAPFVEAAREVRPATAGRQRRRRGSRRR